MERILKGPSQITRFVTRCFIMYKQSEVIICISMTVARNVNFVRVFMRHIRVSS